MNHHPYLHLAVALRGVLFVVAMVACAIIAPPLAEAQTADPPAELQVSALPESGGGTLLGTGAPPVALPDGAATGEAVSAKAECAETATSVMQPLPVWAVLFLRAIALGIAAAIGWDIWQEVKHHFWACWESLWPDADWIQDINDCIDHVCRTHNLSCGG